MKYEVIRDFHDAQDGNYAYHEGDIFPRDGALPSEQRIKDLMNGINFQETPVIKIATEPKVVEIKAKKPKEEPEEKPVEKVTWTEEEILKMPFMKLKSIAKQNGIETKDREASDIRSELIEKLVEV